MAAINYNGMELQSIAECKVFEEPREMLVWNTSYNGPIEKMVCAIIPHRHAGSVITESGAFEYCAEIPEKPAPRRATNRELAKWLAQGNGVVKLTDDTISISWIYFEDCEFNGPIDEYKVRKWGDTEWHEPTVDYMGLDDDKR